MDKETLSSNENINRLKKELSEHHNNNEFLHCNSMSEILKLNLESIHKK